MEKEFLLEMKNIKKSFAGVNALKGVSFNVRRGEIHALMGENGAGKSTLIKILTGVYQADEGEIFMEGRQIHVTDVQKAQKAGISPVYQELNMIPYLSVAENIFLGQYPRNKSGNIEWDKMYEAAEKILSDLELDVDVRAQLNGFGTATQQMISIARAASRECRLLVLDEPTSSLDGNEVSQLFKIVRKLRDKGVSVIFITHRLDEVFELTESITILKDGEYVGTFSTAGMTKEALVTKMVGRKVVEEKRGRAVQENHQDYFIEARHFAKFPQVRDVSFGIKPGEILGMAGLLGSGRTETAQLLFGFRQMDSGTIKINGKETTIKSPKDAIKKGMAFCTEDRREEGIIPYMSVKNNIVLSSMKKISRGIVINKGKQNRVVGDYINALKIKTPNDRQRIRFLSGGNQQKVILARWMATDPKLIILDEPTRGIDVGAKQEVEKLVLDFAAQGISVIYISSELSELVRNCDRIIVLRDGKNVGELSGDDIKEHSIMAMIAAENEEG